jgi:uncharacterized membrane protein
MRLAGVVLGLGLGGFVDGITPVRQSIQVVARH